MVEEIQAAQSPARGRGAQGGPSESQPEAAALSSPQGSPGQPGGQSCQPEKGERDLGGPAG